VIQKYFEENMDFKCNVPALPDYEEEESDCDE